VSNAPELVIPLEHQGRQLGRLALGPRRNARPYSPHDRQLLRGTADAVAAAIALVGTRTNTGKIR
jgi:GAF domain-containing protein